MNNLSWLLYFSGLSANLAPALAFIGITIVFSIAIVTFSEFIEEERFIKRGTKIFFVCLSTFLIVLSTALPSKDTIHMIIASEYGEDVIKSPEAQEVFDKGYEKLLEILE